MIGEISVKESSKSQEIKVKKFTAYVDSKSAVEICDVPDLIGRWKVTGINIVVSYPDNSKTTIQTTKIKDNYVATIQSCSVNGLVKNGLQIIANVEDEKGLNKDSFVLGLGDIEILSRDSSVHPQQIVHYLHLVNSISETPQIGDFITVGETTKYYNGTTWIEIGKPLTFEDTEVKGLIWTPFVKSGQFTLSSTVDSLSAANSYSNNFIKE